MRIVILGDYPPDLSRIGGGVEAVICYLVAELEKFQDIDLHVVTLQNGIQQRRIYQHSNHTVHYVPASYHLANVTFFIVNKIRLLRELAAIRPDVINAHIAGTYAEVALMSRRPAVITPHGIRYREEWLEHGWLNKLMRRPLIRREEKASVRGARHIIAISPYVQEEFGSLIRAIVYPIENPVADKFFELRNDEEAHWILYVGNISSNKAVHHLVQALLQVRERIPAAQLRLAGAPYKKEKSYWHIVQALVKDHGLEGNVHFLGWLHEERLLEEYERCALLVLPSRQETSPMVIQQAMAAGKPVVATRVGGIPYLVHHEQTGLLVDYGDVDGLVDAISLILSDHSLRQRMGVAAREQAVQRFKAANVAHRTRQVYQTVLKSYQTNYERS